MLQSSGGIWYLFSCTNGGNLLTWYSTEQVVNPPCVDDSGGVFGTSIYDIVLLVQQSSRRIWVGTLWDVQAPQGQSMHLSSPHPTKWCFCKQDSICNGVVCPHLALDNPMHLGFIHVGRRV
mmetsp:Transcript_4832/g.30720  ORF Transcript_4832/g.30720 Transcript_4832/m.30720 type:complete len:121 (-) Transcript_4832:1330-1692(-)